MQVFFLEIISPLSEYQYFKMFDLTQAILAQAMLRRAIFRLALSAPVLV